MRAALRPLVFEASGFIWTFPPFHVPERIFSSRLRLNHLNMSPSDQSMNNLNLDPMIPATLPTTSPVTVTLFPNHVNTILATRCTSVALIFLPVHEKAAVSTLCVSFAPAALPCQSMTALAAREVSFALAALPVQV